MIKILFICLGNICRSPMAEFVLKDMAARRGLASKFYIASAATSAEELGNPVHRGTREKLRACGISTAGKYAVQMKRQTMRTTITFWEWRSEIFPICAGLPEAIPDGKMYRLLDFSPNPRDIADPWYTGNFDLTYDDIVEGCEAFLEFLAKEHPETFR